MTLGSYQRVKDCLGRDSPQSEDGENDPNYESLDEARAKMAVVTSGNSREHGASVASPIHLVQFPPTQNGVFSSVSPVIGHLDLGTVGLSPQGHQSQGHTYSTPSKRASVTTHQSSAISSSVNYRVRRRPDHDYEEVDLSPTSESGMPVSPHRSPLHTPTTTVPGPLPSVLDSEPQPPTSPRPHSHIHTVHHSHAHTHSQPRPQSHGAMAPNHFYEELTDVRQKKNGLTSSGNHDKHLRSNNSKHTTEHNRNSGENSKLSNSEGNRRRNGDSKTNNSTDEHKTEDFAQISHTRL